MKVELLRIGVPVAITVERDGTSWRVRLPDESEKIISVARLPSGLLQIREGERVFRAGVQKVGAETNVSYEGQVYTFRHGGPEASESRASVPTGDLIAPMPGVVSEVMVTPGQAVTAYQPLVAVEAMKVIATVEAPFAGKVAEVRVTKGQRVAQGETMLVVRPEESVDE